MSKYMEIAVPIEQVHELVVGVNTGSEGDGSLGWKKCVKQGTFEYEWIMTWLGTEDLRLLAETFLLAADMMEKTEGNS